VRFASLADARTRGRDRHRCGGRCPPDLASELSGCTQADLPGRPRSIRVDSSVVTSIVGRSRSFERTGRPGPRRSSASPPLVPRATNEIREHRLRRMGEVYRVHDRDLDRLAMKVVRSRWSGARDLRRSPGAASARLEHPDRPGARRGADADGRLCSRCPSSGADLRAHPSGRAPSLTEDRASDSSRSPRVCDTLASRTLRASCRDFSLRT
jgi:hypothetical protein